MKMANSLCSRVNHPVRLMLFTRVLWVACMVLLLASCQSSDIVCIEDIEAHKADQSSEKMPHIKLAKHPTLHIAERRSPDSHFRVSLKNGLDGRPLLVIHPLGPRTLGANESTPLQTGQPYVVSHKGHISPYHRNDKGWCIMVLWANDEGIIIWNRLGTGDHAHFRHESAPYVYKKVRFSPCIKELD